MLAAKFEFFGKCRHGWIMFLFKRQTSSSGANGSSMPLKSFKPGKAGMATISGICCSIFIVSPLTGTSMLVPDYVIVISEKKPRVSIPYLCQSPGGRESGCRNARLKEAGRVLSHETLPTQTGRIHPTQHQNEREEEWKSKVYENFN